MPTCATKAAVSAAPTAATAQRNLLVIAQVALSMVLLVGSGLLLRSFLRIRNASPGFDPSSTLTMQITLPRARYSEPDQIIAFYRGVLRQVRNLPGVVAATISTAQPVAPTHFAPVLFEGQPAVALANARSSICSSSVPITSR